MLTALDLVWEQSIEHLIFEDNAEWSVPTPPAPQGQYSSSSARSSSSASLKDTAGGELRILRKCEHLSFLFSINDLAE